MLAVLITRGGHEGRTARTGDQLWRWIQTPMRVGLTKWEHMIKLRFRAITEGYKEVASFKKIFMICFQRLKRFWRHKRGTSSENNVSTDTILMRSVYSRGTIYVPVKGNEPIKITQDR